MLGDPGFVVGGGGFRAGRDGGPVGTDDGHLRARIGLPAAAPRRLGPVAAAATLLREQRRDPGAIDEVRRAAKGREEKQIEEDAVSSVHGVSIAPLQPSRGRTGGGGISAHICGSRRLVSGSTTVTVSL